jgi:predicted NodU family carbamoyl transferase
MRILGLSSLGHNTAAALVDDGVFAVSIMKVVLFRGGYGMQHLSHAASAYLSSPLDKVAILTVEGVGRW